MIRFPRLVALVLLLAPAAACTHPTPPSIIVHAEPGGQAGALTVVGSSTLAVAPDCADLVLTVTAHASHPGDAIAHVRERQAALLDALDRLGVDGSDVTLSQLGVDPAYVWNGQRNELDGYQARITITATTRQFDPIGPLMEAAAGAGVTEMSSRFRRSDLDALKQKVRADAIAAAQAKAQETAASLGIALGRVSAVSDASQSFLYSNEYFPSAGSGGGGGIGGDLQPLTIEVTISYALPEG